MKPIHASIKVSREELDATNGYTVGEQYTPFVQKLITQVKEKASNEEYTWYLYDRFPHGSEEEVILILQNKLMDRDTKTHLQAGLVAMFNSNFEYIKPKANQP